MNDEGAEGGGAGIVMNEGGAKHSDDCFLVVGP